MNTPTAPPAPPFREALAFWFRLGLISFGGPAGQIAILHSFLVEKKRWISETKFMHALNYCMLLPGPEAQQLATYTGWLLHGIRGGLAAGLLFILPSAVLLWGLSMVYVLYGQVPAVQSVLDFLKPAVVAVIAGAIIKIGKKSLLTPWHYGMAIAAFAALFFLKVPYPLVVLAAILLGVVQYFLAKNNTATSAQKKSSPNEEHLYVINQTTVTGAPFSGRRLLLQVGIALILMGLPLLAAFYWSSDFAFWKQIALFFTQAAFVTFGGAYAVLPYVAQVSVEKYAWLTQLQMLDGLALGETTPGPLIMVLAFVGFMAGHTTSGGSLVTATAGLAATVFYTFLPSFLFIFAGAPIIERTQSNPAVKAVLQFVTAAVTGVILSLCLQLGQAVLFTPGFDTVHWSALIWMVISFAALQSGKIGLMGWIGISIAAGIVQFLINV